MTTAEQRAGLDAVTAAAVLAACPDAVVAVDEDLTVIAWNAAAEALFGWTADEVIGGSPPHLDATDRAVWLDRLRTGDAAPLPLTQSRRHKDGSQVVCSVEREVTLHDAEGTVTGAARFYREPRSDPGQHRERNRYSQALAEAVDEAEVVERFGRVVRGLLGTDVAVVLAPGGDAGELEGSFGVGIPPQAVSGIRWSPTEEFSSPPTVSSLRIADDEVPVLMAPMGSAEAGWWLALAYADGVPDSPGLAALAQALGGEAWVALSRVRLVAQLRDQIAALEMQTRQRIDYVAGITHDLRAPLTGLLGFVRTLRRTVDHATPDERREYLEVMERQTTRLAGMVEDLLTGARLETGQLHPDEVADVDMVTLLAEGMIAFDPEQRARIVAHADSDLVVRGDRRLLQRVVQNLLSNALSYSDGTVEVRVHRAGAAEPQIVLTVSDQGPGIDAATKARLFRRFQRGAGPRRDSTGLGLYIVAGIVDAHGGSVDVDSEPGRGSVFTVRLPAGGAARALAAPS